MLFLQSYGVSTAYAAKIYREYGSESIDKVRENPYRLADDIWGIGFKTADGIAGKMGYGKNDARRCRSGILYTLGQLSDEGHVYAEREQLVQAACTLLEADAAPVCEALERMILSEELITEREAIYLPAFYHAECGAARRLKELAESAGRTLFTTELDPGVLTAETGIDYDDVQLAAIRQAVTSKVMVLTGGPGTGKTTTTQGIIAALKKAGLRVLLAAPTGRAAKRMSEATGMDAKTIHRLLELTGTPGEGDDTGSMHFERNEENPLDADVIIIDEMSMVDIQLMQNLLKAVNVGTRLILVGDVNQLPSVGPGNVLKDMIASEEFNVVKLTHIFRQAAESDIIVNAHKINEGERVDLAKRSRDFLFIRRENPDAIISAMLTLITQKLPGYVNAKPFDIQIMTPMRKGALGVEALNKQLQEKFNPPAPNKQEKESGGTIFRVGDKVMQIKNNYQIEWEVRNRYGIPVDKGEGVFNGDTGIIRSINSFAETMEVEFDERRMVEYSFKQLEELELAYAITIHKSQGSEYPAVVIPVHSGPRMLMTRNLIYTAVTRAKSCVCLVGIPEVFQAMVDNEVEQKRYSGLKDRILEIDTSMMQK